MPIVDNRIYSSPVTSNKSAGTIVDALKMEKHRISCGNGYRLLFDSRRPPVKIPYSLATILIYKVHVGKN